MTENTIKNRIYGNGRGWVFSPNHFQDIGSPNSIRVSLYRLEEKKIIRRLAHGFYDYPKKHKTLGMLPPAPEKVAQALAHRDQVRVQPAGAYAANLLGLTEQVPAKIVFLTEGSSKKILIGKQSIVFTKTTPKNMKMAGTISGLLVQALKNIGRQKITTQMIRRLKTVFKPEHYQQLKKDLPFMPQWVAQLVQKEFLKKDI